MSTKQSLGQELVRIIVPILIVGVGCGALYVFGAKPEVPQRDLPDDRGVAVETAAVETFSEPFHIDVDGVAVPFREVTVSAQVEGRIDTMSDDARGGSFVPEGGSLFRIEKVDYGLQVKQLEAQLTRATEDIKAVDVDLNNARAILELSEQDWTLQKNETGTP